MAYEFSFDLDEESFVRKQYPLSEQCTFRTTECKHVEEIIMSMPSNKAPGNDKIPVRVIKDGPPSILPTITSIISTSLGTCTFPSIRKTAEVTPIPKEGDHEQASTNRPISLLPVLSKVCKRVVHNQFSSCLNEKGRLAKNQSTNKAWHSTKNSVIKTTDEIQSAVHQRKLTAITLLEFSKAFDSIAKLHDVRASHSSIQWFCSYLNKDVK